MKNIRQKYNRNRFSCFVVLYVHLSMYGTPVVKTGVPYKKVYTGKSADTYKTVNNIIYNGSSSNITNHCHFFSKLIDK